MDDKISKIVWIKYFLEHQGFKPIPNILHQYNQSTIKLQENRKESSGKRTHHFNIKYFYITDLIRQKEVEVKHCLSNYMLADYMTKPLTGEKFVRNINIIMKYAQ